jgi:hypothetical protein
MSSARRSLTLPPKCETQAIYLRVKLCRVGEISRDTRLKEEKFLARPGSVEQRAI